MNKTLSESIRDTITQLEKINEVASYRDRIAERFWWFDKGDIIELDSDTTHGDYAIQYWELHDPDELAFIDDDSESSEENVNNHFIETTDAVRGGIMELSPKEKVVYLDGSSVKRVHKCLKDILNTHPDISLVQITVGPRYVELSGSDLEFFIRRGTFKKK